MVFRSLLIFILIFSANLVCAQDVKRPAGADKKTTSINFEDELVEGEVKKPELLYLLQKKQFNFKRLIKLRENFLPEMSRTAEDVGRRRGGS
jgi:hypothetical protein